MKLTYRPRARSTVAGLGALLWGFFFFGLIDLLVRFLPFDDFYATYLLETGWGVLYFILVTVPLLSVMHNNRGYHQEVMHVQRIADRRDHVLNDGPIGTQITGPDIDYAKLAQSMGMFAIGPIENPADLGPALARAVAVVKAGEPALVDVVSQPR